MPTKLKVPEGCGGVGHAGVNYTPDENGIIEVADGADLAPLFDHGLTLPPIEVKKAKQAEGDQGSDDEREALFNRAVDMGLKPHYKAGIPRLTEMIAEAEERAAADAEAKKAEGADAQAQDAPAGE